MSYFETRERALLGNDYEVLYESDTAVYRGITVNTLRCAPADFSVLHAFDCAPSSFCDTAFVLQNPQEKPGLSPYHHAGVFYVQEPSASIAATLLGVQPGDTVLDLCAAPGGKTSQLAAALQGEGLLVANEYMSARATILKNNLERMGVTNAVVLNEDTARIAKALPAYFNRVLVDAPCSGEGMFRKEPQAVTQHCEGLVLQCAALGAQILDNAAACLAPGGTLVYSTCTFAPQEDEMQIGAFLARHPEFELLPIEISVGSEGEVKRAGEYDYPVHYTRRIYPCHGGEGHFMAKLHKKGQTVSTLQKPPKTKPMPTECENFLKTYFPSLLGKNTKLIGDSVYLLPNTPLPPLAKLHCLQAGVLAGAMVKNRFVPAHNLFMAYGAQCTNAEHLTQKDDRTAAWLRGEEIEVQTAQQGYCAVLCDGFPLGFGKQSGEKVKNHYPKGLRNLK